MIFFEDFEKRLVIPVWLNYEKVVKSRELTYGPLKQTQPLNRRTKKSLVDDYEEFKVNPSSHRATDLMASAFIVGEIDVANEIAHYIKQRTDLQKPAMDLADYVLNGAREIVAEIVPRTRVAQIRRFLGEFPNDPLAWIQLGRFYTILGQTEKAGRCVRVAVKLAPSDRYIARSAVRFFIHAGDVESAWEYIKRASEAKFDPWIKATEVSVAELMEKKVKKLKNMLPASPSPDQIFHNSELIEALGMLELLSGNDHRAKKNFKLAWLNPSKNVVTHSEWIVRNKFPALEAIAKPNFSHSLEAITLQNYFSSRIPEALHAVTEWALEEPFSKRPFVLGSSLACANRDFALAIRLSREGLTANPKEFILRNNLCFALLRANRVEDAKREIALMPAASNSTEEIVGAATQGLLAYKRGNIAVGRVSYLEAISRAKSSGDNRLAAKALIHFAITELEAGVSTAKETCEMALKEAQGIELPDVALDRSALETASVNAEGAQPLVELPQHLKGFGPVKILPPNFLK